MAASTSISHSSGGLRTTGSEPLLAAVDIQRLELLRGFLEVDDPLNQADDAHHEAGSPAGDNPTGQADHDGLAAWC